MAKLGNLATRVLVAVVAVPLLLLAIYQPRHEVVWAIAFAASLLTMHEFFTMTLEGKADRTPSLLIGAAATAAFYWLPARYAPFMTPFLAAFLLPALYYLFRPGDIPTVAARLAFTAPGILYGGLLFTFLALIKRDLPHGDDYIVLMLATAWLSDTGGYFAGKFLGKRKLYPLVSPNKTWAGSIGGVAAAVAGGIAIERFRLQGLTWYDVALLSGVGSVLGQLGDLIESLIKRSRGVKDSGAILPGHGGLLDRVDAVLFIAPFFYLYAIMRAAF
jgi:phosphatidate cytidylyltransferase